MDLREEGRNYRMIGVYLTFFFLNTKFTNHFWRVSMILHVHLHGTHVSGDTHSPCLVSPAWYQVVLRVRMALSALIDSSVVSGSAAHLCVLVCCHLLLMKGLHFLKYPILCGGRWVCEGACDGSQCQVSSSIAFHLIYFWDKASH